MTEKLQKVKLIALDVDGVLTDGTLAYYGSDGIAQHFNAHDGAGIARAIAEGIHIALISFRDLPSTRARARDLGIKYLFLGCSDKSSALRQISDFLKIPLGEVLFMGDDRLDIPALETAGISACPANAHEEVKSICNIVTVKSGGHGAVREIIDSILVSYSTS